MYSHPFYGILYQRFSQCNTARKKKIIKGKQVKKEESLYLFVENIIIYIGNPEKITKGN